LFNAVSSLNFSEDVVFVEGSTRHNKRQKPGSEFKAAR
jgi:hypothetical protein